jgi:hypothetical protein
MKNRIAFLFLFVVIIFAISLGVSADSADLKIEYHDFIYAYSGDYVSIVGKLTNMGDKDYQDIVVVVTLYDQEGQVISCESIWIPYILSKEDRYFKKMTPRNIGINRSSIEIKDYSILNEKVCNREVSILENKKYKYKTKFREYLAVEGILLNNSEISLNNIRIDGIFLDEEGIIIDLNSCIISSLLPDEYDNFTVSSAYVDKVYHCIFQMTCFNE